jgi:hypothetical protein
MLSACRCTAILQQRPDPGDRVADHPHLLPFLPRARAVVHRQFQRPVSLSQQLDHDLEVEVEPVALEGQPVQAISTEDLEHAEGILEPLPVDEIEEPQEDDVPEVEHRGQRRRVVELPDLPGASFARMS